MTVIWVGCVCNGSGIWCTQVRGKVLGHPEKGKYNGRTDPWHSEIQQNEVGMAAQHRDCSDL